jgi:ABC-type multidrug transport system fused ATPase/permease subunit
MKIVQLFTREVIEADKFQILITNTKKAWIKTILYNSIFFPIADIISSLTLGFIVLYGGMKILNGDTFTTFGIYSLTPCLLLCCLTLYDRLQTNSMKCN